MDKKKKNIVIGDCKLWKQTRTRPEQSNLRLGNAKNLLSMNMLCASIELSDRLVRGLVGGDDG